MKYRTAQTLVLSLALLIPGIAQAQPVNKPDHCDQFVPFGYPKPIEKTETTPLCRIAYFTLHDDKNKTPLYSAEYLIPENVDGEAPRKNNFRPDPGLERGKRSENADYVGSGYDRGHLAPAESFRKNSVLMSQSFYLSNMVPETPGLNRGPLRMLEFYIITRVRNGESLYVLTGPIFDAKKQKFIGPNRIPVPSAVFKVIVSKQKNTIEAYIIPNVDDPAGSYPNFLVPVEEVGKRARMVLMPERAKLAK
jgi:endonuclease G, mitochondrial